MQRHANSAHVLLQADDSMKGSRDMQRVQTVPWAMGPLAQTRACSMQSLLGSDADGIENVSSGFKRAISGDSFDRKAQLLQGLRNKLQEGDVSAQDLTTLASGYLFAASRDSTPDPDSPVAGKSPVAPGRGLTEPLRGPLRGPPRGRTCSNSSVVSVLEPKVSWQRQLRQRINAKVGLYVAMLLLSILMVCPLTKYDWEIYGLHWKARTTACVACWCLFFIAADGAPAGVCLFGGTVLLSALGIITPVKAFDGFSNPCVVAIAALNLLARALENSGALESAIAPILGTPKSLRSAIVRLMLPVALCSAFMNNTPVVAMMIPLVKGWSAKTGFSLRQLMLPLAFASTLGGALTLIGSGTNLVSNNWAMLQHAPDMGFFGLTSTGSVLMVVGIAYMAIAVPYLVAPDEEVDEDEENPGVPTQKIQYLIPFYVGRKGPFNTVIGGSVQSLGLASVPGSKLLEGDRRTGRSTTSPASKQSPSMTRVLGENDELVFCASAQAVVSLRFVQGLFPAAWEAVKLLGTKRSRRRHYEVVLAPTSDLVGLPMDLKEFRQAFRAVPLAVWRPGVPGLCLRREFFEGLEEFVPQSGDVFLLEAFLPGPPPGCYDFLFVREVPNSAPPRLVTAMDLCRQRCILIGLICMVVASISGCSLAVSSVLLVMFLVLIKALSMEELYNFLNGPMLLTIAASFGIGAGIEQSGLADIIASIILSAFSGFGPYGIVVGIYICAMVIGQLVSNVTTALIVLPMAPALAKSTGLSLMLFVRIVIFSANASFASPLATATNLMVVPQAGYTFTDFLKVGGPLQLLFIICTCAIEMGHLTL
eukprot:TRINITY_DN66274_c0_g4_i1.p1 TRINITY_DN66274_c0_g4~~TRINITY_DN66274_c0_g4_i1.p1  ORF type:complete len:818 (-),score=170.22 TRINITY_DN66274_c0_g4_i1:444-2897(-)